MSASGGRFLRRAAAAAGASAVVVMAGIGAACGSDYSSEGPPLPQQTSIISSVWSTITSWVETEYSTVSSTVTTLLKSCEAVVENYKDRFETRTPTCATAIRG